MAQADRAAIARNVLDLDRLTPHCGAEVRDIDLSARLGDAQIAAPREVRTTQLRDVMTADSQTVAPEESLGYALLLMHENGLRHLPVFEDGVAIGILSARNALDPELEEFESESRRREDLRRKARSAGGTSDSN